MSDQDVDNPRRRFLLTATSVVGGIGAACAAVPFLSSWWPSAAAAAAAAPVEVDVSKIESGQRVIIEWRGKPVWIIRRTDAMLSELQTESIQQHLRDPASEVVQQPEYAKNTYRSVKPEFLVLVGICTHLGCSPSYRPGIGELDPSWRGGFFCPCHGSKFDLSGRVFKGVPAPVNLEVPPYYFLNEQVILVGENPKDNSGRAA